MNRIKIEEWNRYWHFYNKKDKNLRKFILDFSPTKSAAIMVLKNLVDTDYVIRSMLKSAIFDTQMVPLYADLYTSDVDYKKYVFPYDENFKKLATKLSPKKDLGVWDNFVREVDVDLCAGHMRQEPSKIDAYVKDPDRIINLVLEEGPEKVVSYIDGDLGYIFIDMFSRQKDIKGCDFSDRLRTMYL